MPTLITWFWGAFGAILAPIVTRAIVSVGFGWLTLEGVDSVQAWFSAWILNSLQGLPTVLLQMASILKIDVAVNIILAAVTARISMTSLSKLVRR